MKLQANIAKGMKRETTVKSLPGPVRAGSFPMLTVAAAVTLK